MLSNILGAFAVGVCLWSIRVKLFVGTRQTAIVRAYDPRISWRDEPERHAFSHADQAARASDADSS
jgi:hypothetical protein